MVRVQSPPTDVVEESDRYIVFVDVPGVRPEDIKIYGDERSVVIEGYRSIPRSGRFLTIERFSGKFVRRIRFNSFINLSKTKAYLENGVLIINIPKAREEFIIDTTVVKIIVRR